MGEPTKPPERHTPVKPLYSKRGELIGGVCEHCGGILTVAGNISNPVRVQEPRGPGVVRFVENKAHTARLNAERSRTWAHIKDKLIFWRD